MTKQRKIVASSLSAEEVEIIRQGAEIDKRTLSGFVRYSAVERAREIILQMQNE